MAKITNNFYTDGIEGANIEGEIHNLPAGETVATSDEFALEITKIFPNLEVEPDGAVVDKTVEVAAEPESETLEEAGVTREADIIEDPEIE